MPVDGLIEAPDRTSYRVGILAQTKNLLASLPNVMPPFNLPFVIDSGKKVAGIAYTKGSSMALEADGHKSFRLAIIQKVDGSLYTFTPADLASPRSGIKFTFTTSASDDYFTYFLVLDV